MANKKYIVVLVFCIAFLFGVSGSLPKNRSVAHSVNGGTYLGAEACGSCHAETYTTWNDTDHANMAGIAEENASGVFYWVAYPTRVMNETAFLDRCASCHVTGWEAGTQSWPEKETDPGKFLNLQCEGCHGPGDEEPWGTASMVVDYSSALCGQCHSQFGDWLVSPHNDSITAVLSSDHASDTCLSCMSSQGFLGDNDYNISSPDLEPVSCAVCHDPHSRENDYLRFEDSTELCGQCHSGSRHSSYNVFLEGPHDEAELECTSCHGQGERLWHDEPDPWFNHTFGIYNTFYPFNQTDPLVCSSCHTQSWATSRLGVIQDLTHDLILNVTMAIDKALASIDLANQTAGTDELQLQAAADMIETAESYISLVENDGSHGFHDPEQTFGMLGQAAHLTNEAQNLAFEELASGTTSLESQVANLQGQVDTLQEQTSLLQDDIDDLALQLADLESSSAMNQYLYAGIGLVVGFIVGAVIIFAIRRGKQ